MEEGNGNPLQASCLENPYGQKSLVGYSPWGCKEPDMTEVTKHSTAESFFLRNKTELLENRDLCVCGVCVCVCVCECVCVSVCLSVPV